MKRGQKEKEKRVGLVGETWNLPRKVKGLWGKGTAGESGEKEGNWGGGVGPRIVCRGKRTMKPKNQRCKGARGVAARGSSKPKKELKPLVSGRWQRLG